MSEEILHQSPSRAARRGFLPFLWLLFIGSGCAALIYEIVWFQLLQLVIGSSAISLGVLLGTFMGGMCLGSLALARLVPLHQHPLRVYALLEVGIGIFGIMALFVVPSVAQLYAPNAGHGLPGILLRGAVGAVCLLPPTFLMGATLPAIARWIEMTPQGISWLGFFYGGNIAGAVFGCLLAGFYLLRVHDVATATYVAATINGVVAVVGFALAAQTSQQFRQATSLCRSREEHPSTNPNSDQSLIMAAAITGKEEIGQRVADSWSVYLAIALSGLCALGAEVVWTRLLSLMLGPTVYTFSIILAVFLGGLGIGSSAGSLLARWTVRPRIALGCCQILLAAAITWSACMIARSLPYWPINPSLSRSPWFSFQLDLVRCCWAILPATCLWGASFPLALAAVASRGQDPGRVVGRVYAANTVGAIIGAIGSSIFLIGWVGTQQTQRLLIGLSTVAALLMFVPILWPPRKDELSGGQSMKPNLRIGNAVSVLASIGLAGVLAGSVPKVPWELVAHGRYLPTYNKDRKLLYMGEGMNASVAVTEMSDGVRNFHVSGKVEASTGPRDMRLQRMLGHLPALLHPKPRSVLIVGCGAGITAGSFVVHPDVERIVICEIEPLIPKRVAPYFGKENYNVVNDPRVVIIYDDARHYVLTTREKFDIITSDPIHPWVKGAATLYTKEYFELVKQHLNPGGLVTQWVPLYESNSSAVKSEIATFLDIFPNGSIWSNDDNGAGYDILLLGQTGVMKINVDELQQRILRDEPVSRSLGEAGFKSVVSLLATYGGRGSDLRPWLGQAEINRDRNLRLQYLAGLGLNFNQGTLIQDDMLVYRRYPEELFVGSEPRRQMLRLLIERAKLGK
jgi:spermidine synthase